MVPAGLSMAKATESGMEWLTWIGSTVKQPSLILLLGHLISTNLVLPARPCSSSLFLMRPQVRRGAVDGQIKFLQQIRDAADVVLMAVGDEQALDLILILYHEREIGDDHVHAEHITVREDEAAVHNDHIAAALVHGHVLAHFPQAAQRIDVDGHSGLLGLLRAAGTPRIIGAASAGALLAAVVTGPVLGGRGVLFFNLCHSYLQKTNRRTRPTPPGSGRLFCTGKHKISICFRWMHPYRIYPVSAFFKACWWFRNKLSAFPVHLFDATAALIRERCERALTARPYTHFVAISIVFLSVFVNSKVWQAGRGLCTFLLTERVKWL